MRRRGFPSPRRRRLAAPVESGGEAAVHFGPGDDCRREGKKGHAEAQRIGIPFGHAGRRHGDANGADSRSSRARWAAQRASVLDRHRRWRESASEEAGRWLTLASRSSLAKTSRAAGRRNRINGERATPAPRAKRTTPAMRTVRGANCQAPAHEAARKRIKTASANTSGGHTRSARSARRAQTASAASLPPAINELSWFFTATP